MEYKMKKCLALILTLTCSLAFADLVCDDAYLAQFDSAQIVVSAGKSEGFKDIDIKSDISFMGLSLKAGDKVMIYKQSLYGAEIQDNMVIQGYPVSANDKVVFSAESNDIQLFELSSAKTIQDISWPAGSKVSLHVPAQKMRRGGLLHIRHVKISQDMVIKGKNYSAGDTLSFSALNGKIRKIK
jgi:hypothetical protein